MLAKFVMFPLPPPLCALKSTQQVFTAVLRAGGILGMICVCVCFSQATLLYTIMLPGRKSDFRAGFGPDCHRGNTEIGPPAGRRPTGGPLSVFSR